MRRILKASLLALPTSHIPFFWLRLPVRAVKFLFLFFFPKLNSQSLMSANEFARSSNKVFILGSGSSINKINGWDEIKSHDSIGFNFWALHPFVPDFFFVEVPRDKSRRDQLARAICRRSKDYQDTRFFLKNSKESVSFANFIGSYVSYKYFTPFVVSSPTLLLYRKFAKYLFSKVIWSARLFFCNGNSSVDQLIVFCVQVGYKEIVLCGVDLNDVNYFYEEEASVHSSVLDCVVPSGQGNRSVHKTNDTTEPRMGLTVEESIKAIKPLYEELGVTVFVENPSSTLAKILPTYKH